MCTQLQFTAIFQASAVPGDDLDGYASPTGSHATSAADLEDLGGVSAALVAKKASKMPAGWGDPDDNVDGDELEEPEDDEEADDKAGVGLADGAFDSCVCETCAETSDNVKWYDDVPMLKGSEIVNMPTGDACLPCGQAGEGWPNLTRQQIIVLVNNDKPFKKAFFEARERTKVLHEAEFTPSHVFTESRMGMRVHNEAGLVSEEDFTSHLGYPPAEVPGITVVSVVDESGAVGHKRLGVLMQFEDIPNHLPYRNVTLYSDIANVLVETKLRPQDLIRDKQAVEKWEACNKDTVKARASQMQNGLFQVPGFADITKCVDKHKVLLKQKEVELSLQEDGAGTATSSHAGLSRRQAKAHASTELASTKPQKTASGKAKPISAEAALVVQLRKQQKAKAAIPAGASPPGSGRGASSSSPASKSDAGVRVSVGARAAGAAVGEDIDVAGILNGTEKLGTRLNGVHILNVTCVHQAESVSLITFCTCSLGWCPTTKILVLVIGDPCSSCVASCLVS